VARDWCVVARTTDAGAAKRLERLLSEDWISADRDHSRVFAYADDQATAEELRKDLLRSLSNEGLDQTLIEEPSLRRWDESRHRYVDPSQPDRDPDTGQPWDYPGIDPADARWIVRVRPMSSFSHNELRGQLRVIDRPLIVDDGAVFGLGALDEDEANTLASRIGSFYGAGEIITRRLGWWERWRLRWRLGGNYADGGGG